MTDWNPTDDELREIAAEYQYSYPARQLARLVLREREELARERLINRGNGESAAWLNVHRLLDATRARAEQAEAERDELRQDVEALVDDLRAVRLERDQIKARDDQARAALARVTEVCDNDATASGLLQVAQVRAALARVEVLPDNDDDDPNGGYRSGYRMAMRRVRAAIAGPECDCTPSPAGPSASGCPVHG